MRKRRRVCPLCGEDLKKNERLHSLICSKCDYSIKIRNTKKFENFLNSEIR